MRNSEKNWNVCRSTHWDSLVFYEIISLWYTQTGTGSKRTPFQNSIKAEMYFQSKSTTSCILLRVAMDINGHQWTLLYTKEISDRFHQNSAVPLGAHRKTKNGTRSIRTFLAQNHGSHWEEMEEPWMSILMSNPSPNQLRQWKASSDWDGQQFLNSFSAHRNAVSPLSERLIPDISVTTWAPPGRHVEWWLTMIHKGTCLMMANHD